MNINNKLKNIIAITYRFRVLILFLLMIVFYRDSDFRLSVLIGVAIVTDFLYDLTLLMLSKIAKYTRKFDTYTKASFDNFFNKFCLAIGMFMMIVITLLYSRIFINYPMNYRFIFALIQGISWVFIIVPVGFFFVTRLEYHLFSSTYFYLLHQNFYIRLIFYTFFISIFSFGYNIIFEGVILIFLLWGLVCWYNVSKYNFKYYWTIQINFLLLLKLKQFFPNVHTLIQDYEETLLLYRDDHLQTIKNKLYYIKELLSYYNFDSSQYAHLDIPISYRILLMIIRLNEQKAITIFPELHKIQVVFEEGQ